MKKLIWVIPIIMILLSCKSQPKRQAADQNKLSILIFRDFVIVYNGIFDKNTAYKKFLHTEPEKLREVIEQNRLKYGFQSEILLKLAFEGEEDFSFHLSDHLQYMKDIALQNSGPDIKIADITETEEQFFSVLPFKRSFIDSFNKPLALDLKMPRDESAIDNLNVGSPDPVEIKTPKSKASQILPDSSIVIIDIKKDSSVWFSNFTGKSGKYDKVSIKLKVPITVELSQFIRSEITMYSLYEKVYIIRAAPNTAYSTVEKVIEALKQNNIYKYKLVTTE